MPRGLEALALDELRKTVGDAARLPVAVEEGSGFIQMPYHGQLGLLLKLRLALSVYLVQTYEIPRPKALLGHQHLQTLLKQIETARSLWSKGSFQTLYVSAAGSESSVMQRLKDELAAQTGLQVASHEGDLLLRIRVRRDNKPGWETVVRLSPRPLSTRAWRVCNYEGALNACVAYGMVQLTRPGPQDIYLNLACGSGGLLIERLAHGPAKKMIGLDLDRHALRCTQSNLEATRRMEQVRLVQGDASVLPLPDRSVSAISADLPFGHLVGSHAENVELYPRILSEAARVARPGARFCLITHEVQLSESLLQQSREWQIEQVLKVWLGGLHPRIFVMRRSEKRATR